MSWLYNVWPRDPIWVVPWSVVIGLIVIATVVEVIKSRRNR